MSVERVVGVVSAAMIRIQENPELAAKSKKDNPSEPLANQDPLHMPDKVTLHWLYKNVPYSFWLWFAGAMAASFAIGATAAMKLSVVQQWFGALCGVQP